MSKTSKKAEKRRSQFLNWDRNQSKFDAPHLKNIKYHGLLASHPQKADVSARTSPVTDNADGTSERRFIHEVGESG
jgi:hypothetical protein